MKDYDKLNGRSKLIQTYLESAACFKPACFLPDALLAGGGLKGATCMEERVEGIMCMGEEGRGQTLLHLT